MKRKLTSRQFAIVAEYIDVPLNELIKLYKRNLINTNRLYELWQKALYGKGILKRKIRCRSSLYFRE